MLAKGHWINAGLSLSANQRLDGAVAAWTESHPLWISWTWPTCSFMASLLAIVFSAVELMVADSSTREFGAATGRLPFLLSAVALGGDNKTTRGAGTLMAVSLALVEKTV